MNRPKLTQARYHERFSWPRGRVEVVLDTDTYNEIDDQFALVYALLASERIDLTAVYAAPFHNSRSKGPRDGMEKSFEEILRVLELMKRPSEGLAFKGATQWLTEKDAAVLSPAMEDLITCARRPRANPLYVVAIGAATNIASAIIGAPDIIENLVVLWLGGHPLHWHHANEFNLKGDPKASRILLDSGVPLYLFPWLNVSEQLRTTLAEMKHNVRPHGEIGRYLFEIFANYRGHDLSAMGASKVIWDMALIGWLVNNAWYTAVRKPSPILTSDLTWKQDSSRHPIMEVLHLKRDRVFGDFFRRLEKHAESRLSS